jgi:hypothetical protein
MDRLSLYYTKRSLGLGQRVFQDVPSIRVCFFYDLVEFMSRELTYEKDTLPALSGLAAKLAVIHGSEYIAGLWKDNILLYLFWRLALFRRRWKQLVRYRNVLI